MSKPQRNFIISRLYSSRLSGAQTPPRSSSLDQKGVSQKTECSPADWISAFPPSRREYSSKISANAGLGHQGQARDSAEPESSSRWTMLPASANAFFDPDALTPTGFSVEDLKLLGHFPDYAELSGVPLPEAYPEFDIDKAIARPYRPFRWSYHQTMSLTKMEPDWWLELEKHYALRIHQRIDLFAEHGKAVLDCLPGSELACKELMEMSLQFLIARYPQYFSLSPDATMFHNRILKNTTNLITTDPLHVLLHNVPEDFAMMLRNSENGFYYFRAGVVCSALGWNLGTKIGLQLHQIHAPIPDYKEKMQMSMDRYFARFSTDRPIQRGSWGLEIDQPLFMPPGDPHEALRTRQDPTTTLEQCHLRVDWQTLRRLPLSGSIVFNFKALFTPVEKFRHEPYIPAICGKLLREGKENLMRYKGTWHVEHVVEPKMREWEREQIERGLVEEQWEVRTLEQAPWYPGWKQRWHEEQGF